MTGVRGVIARNSPPVGVSVQHRSTLLLRPTTHAYKIHTQKDPNRRRTANATKQNNSVQKTVVPVCMVAWTVTVV